MLPESSPEAPKSTPEAPKWTPEAPKSPLGLSGGSQEVYEEPLGVPMLILEDFGEPFSEVLGPPEPRKVWFSHGRYFIFQLFKVFSRGGFQKPWNPSRIAARQPKPAGLGPLELCIWSSKRLGLLYMYICICVYMYICIYVA